jgi:hypothetical protein
MPDDKQAAVDEKVEETKTPAAKAAPSPQGERPGAKAAGGSVTLVWDDTEMRTTFANVVNVNSTQEEVMLFFGTNQTWNAQRKGQIEVKLEERVILSPFAAKRLAVLLDSVMKEYEKRFGKLQVEGTN